MLENIKETIAEAIYHQLASGFHFHRWINTPGTSKMIRETYKREKIDVVYENCKYCEKHRTRITRIWKK